MSDPKVHILKKSEIGECEAMDEEPQVIQINDNESEIPEFDNVEIVGIPQLSTDSQAIVKPVSIQIKVGDEIISNGNSGKYSAQELASQSTSSKPATEEENVFLIPPLLRIRHYATEERIPISINEIRRRIKPPESLSQSLILNLLRLNKERAKHLRKALSQFGIKELPSKSAVVSSFSRLSEAEATALAEDYHYLSSKFMKVKDMHNSLVNLNGGEEQYLAKANSARSVLEQILSAIEKQDEELTMLTHGFSPLILRSVFTILTEILTYKEREAEEITVEMTKEEPEV